MAFCTTCGANVAGAFCTQCGTPVSAAGAKPAAAPPQAPPPQQAPQPGFQPPAPAGAAYQAAQPVKRGTSPLVWVLVVILGLFVLGGIAMIGVGYFVVHKVKQAGIDPDLMQRNPGLAVSKMLAAVNPNVEVVSTNDGAGTITLRDKKTGKVVTMSFDDVKNGRFKFSAEGDDGKTATMEFGAGSTARLPSWIPSYPGSNPQGTFSAKGDDGSGQGEGGMYSFTTSDPASKVLEFYQDKAKELGMKVNMNTTTPDGGMLILADDDSKRSLTITVGRGSDAHTSVAVTYGSKK